MTLFESFLLAAGCLLGVGLFLAIFYFLLGSMVSSKKLIRVAGRCGMFLLLSAFLGAVIYSNQ